MLVPNIDAGVKDEGQGPKPAGAGLAGISRSVGESPESCFRDRVPERGNIISLVFCRREPP